MDEIFYKPNVYYIFAKEDNYPAWLSRVQCIGPIFITQKGCLKYDIMSGDELLDGDDSPLLD